MSKIVTDVIERTEEYNAFIEELKAFHNRKGTTLLSEPVLGGKKIDLHKLYQEVVAAGGFDQVTKKRSWKQIGAVFEFPATCTNSAYILKGLYIRNLLGWEEEQIWRKEWIPPEELKGPEAHKASTLAGKTYKKCKHRHHNHNHEDMTAVLYETPILPLNINTQQKKTLQPSILPFNLITTSEAHQCEISELHHRTQPFNHVHSFESDSADRDCVTGNNFDENTKKRMIPALQSQNQADVEWALNNIVTISYECPQKLLLNENPELLEALLNKAQACLQDTLFKEQEQDAQKDSHKTILKILHISRNFSFIESNTRVFAKSADFKQMLIKCLVMANSSHYSHCIDILENMTPFVELGPFDAIIGCLNNLLMNATERSVILGSVRVLTMLASSAPNLHYLLPTSNQIANRITQFLIANDEELIGVSLEYLYQYSRQSISFGHHLLQLHDGADIGIMVSLLMTPCKYFRPVLVQHSSPSPPLSTADNNMFFSAAANGHIHNHQHQQHGNEPCVPNLTSYQQLDEPYRCLGWLKDKFELSNACSELSLDDMYLLYEMRFGHEKALRMKEFYTVLRIAFPIATGSSEPGSPIQQQNGAGAILEGTTIRGLQVKMCILQDGSELMCQWTNCSQSFDDEQLLQSHVLHDHIPSAISSTSISNCMWMDCEEEDHLFRDPNELTTHVRDSHLPPGYIDTSEIQGVALVAAQLLKVLSKNPSSHVAFMPYEQELVMMTRKRPKLTPFIEVMFSNFRIGSTTTSTTSSISSSS